MSLSIAEFAIAFLDAEVAQEKRGFAIVGANEALDGIKEMQTKGAGEILTDDERAQLKVAAKLIADVRDRLFNTHQSWVRTSGRSSTSLTPEVQARVLGGR